jgi:hypothetical protein
MALVIQGEDEEELPEHILGVIRLGNVDLSKAKTISELRAASPVGTPPDRKSSGSKRDSAQRTLDGNLWVVTSSDELKKRK